jgi:DnaJ-class molecular chaperone
MATETAVLFEEIARLNQENKKLRGQFMRAVIDVHDLCEGRKVSCPACKGSGSNRYGVGCVHCNGDGFVVTEAAKHEDAVLVDLEGG